MTQGLSSLDDTVHFDPPGVGASSVRVDGSSAINGDDTVVVNDLSASPLSFACELRKAIQEQVGQRVHGLSVEQIGCDIVISGTATSYHVKQLVTHAVMPLLTQETLTNAVRVDVPR